MVISVLFYFAFRRNDLPILPYSYLSKTPTGLPGMDRKPIRKSTSSDERGKPLPPPKMPVAPVPLVVKVAPSGPPIEKPMMT
jgi:hypothetical protein